mmetsp:Transcript_35986/g.113091  ORF Transcript_35986/g.113091 Transcript_35986/m.113091 type:complete len:177 (+) Transcript_35986:307-837(+)
MAAKPDAKAAADCDEVACSSKMAAFRGMLGLGAAPAASAGAATRCPPDRDEIGRSGWTLLHTTAAYYPADPTSKDVRAAQNFVDGFAALYPCVHCAEDFREQVRRNPPRLASREAFSVWACEQHNAVNAKLGKPIVKCSFAKLEEMWRTGSAACRSQIQQDDVSTPEETLGQFEGT